MTSSYQTHHIYNEPISIFNIHKYLSYLWVIGIIPYFDITFNDNFTEMQILTAYRRHDNKWGKYGLSIITYNINTRKWKSIIDTMTYEDLKNQYPYLIEKNLVSVSYNQPYVEYVLESYDINDILEPSLNPFDNIYINDVILQNLAMINLENNYQYPAQELINILKPQIRNSFNLRFLLPISVNTISNIVEAEDLCTFLNNFIEFENTFKFEEYKNTTSNLPEEIWKIIFEYYKNPKIDYEVFQYEMWI